MADMKTCEVCGMEYDWPGVAEAGHEYCCAACARGEECTCPQHRHQPHSDQPLNAAAASQLGVSAE
jgi:hypothetical protein